MTTPATLTRDRARFLDRYERNVARLDPAEEQTRRAAIGMAPRGIRVVEASMGDEQP